MGHIMQGGGATPLMEAAKGGHAEVVQLLVAKGADVSLRDDLGRTALHYAVVCDHTDVARMLLDAGADVNAEDNDGLTPLALIMSIDKGEDDGRD